MTDPHAGVADRYDIAIVGASFVGQALALALARTLGPEVRIALIGERAKVAVDDVRASAIAAGSQRLLAVLGLWERIAPEAQPVRRIELTDTPLHAGVRPVLARYDTLLDDDEPATFIVPNATLDLVLSEAATVDGSIVSIAGQVATIQTTDALAAVRLMDGRQIAAPLLIGADGRGSRVRQAAGIGVVRFGGGQTGIVTRIRHELPHDGVAVQHFLPGGPFAILPLPGQRSCITWSEDADTARHILALDDPMFLGELDRRVAGRLGVLTLDGPRRSWPLETQLARAYVARRVALVGDAAHGVHPIAGQGLNLGLRDVAALVEVLAETARLGLDVGDPVQLSRYERWRRFDSFTAAAAFEGLNRFFSNDTALVRSVREVGLGLVDRFPMLKSVLVREAAGLTGRVPLLLKGELPG